MNDDVAWPAEMGAVLGVFRPSGKRVVVGYVASTLMGILCLFTAALAVWFYVDPGRSNGTHWFLGIVSCVFLGLCIGGWWYSRTVSQTRVAICEKGLIFRTGESHKSLGMEAIDSAVELTIHNRMPVKGSALMPRIATKCCVLNYKAAGTGHKMIDNDSVEDMDGFYRLLRGVAERCGVPWQVDEVRN